MNRSHWLPIFVVVLCAVQTHRAHAQYTPPRPAPICEICGNCTGCVRMCTDERQPTLAGVEINTGAPGSMEVDAAATLPGLMRLHANTPPQCDCAHGDEVYFAAAGEDHTTGLTTVALDGSSNLRVRAQMCTAEVVSLSRPQARCPTVTGTQAPFVVGFTTPTDPPTYAWDESGIREACLEADNPCPADYTYNGAGLCTATTLDTTAMVTETKTWTRESRIDVNTIWRYHSRVVWAYPTPSSVPALTCPDGTAPDSSGECLFAHNAISRYRTRAALQTARGTSLDTEAPDFFGTNATHTLTLPDPVVSHVGQPPTALAGAFPRIAIPPATRTFMTTERTALSNVYPYVAFGDDVVDSRPGGRPYGQLGTNAVHLLQDIRPAQFFETEINVCSPDTAYDTVDDRCEGRAEPVRFDHPDPSADPSITCPSGYSAYALVSDHNNIQVGWDCWAIVTSVDSDPLDMDDETDTRTVTITYRYYPNDRTLSIRTYNDAELRRVANPGVLVTTYDTQACRHGFPGVIEDADTGSDITVCFTNGRWPPDGKYAGIAPIVPPATFEDFFPAAGAENTGYDPADSVPDGVVEIVRSSGGRLRYTIPR